MYSLIFFLFLNWLCRWPRAKPSLVESASHSFGFGFFRALSVVGENSFQKHLFAAVLEVMRGGNRRKNAHLPIDDKTSISCERCEWYSQKNNRQKFASKGSPRQQKTCLIWKYLPNHCKNSNPPLKSRTKKVLWQNKESFCNPIARESVMTSHSSPQRQTLLLMRRELCGMKKDLCAMLAARLRPSRSRPTLSLRQDGAPGPQSWLCGAL